jgi:hypothetical protein
MKVHGQLHAQATLLRGKIFGIQWIGGWVGPRASMDNVVKRKIFASTENNTKYIS